MNRYDMQKGRLPLLPLFLAGFAAGILLMNLGKSVLLENTDLLDEYTLYHMKYMTVDSNAFFCYVLRMRFQSVAVWIVLATTYLGMLVCMGVSLWYGLSAGAFVAAVLLRYGLKGILLVLSGIFPHYLLYAPAVVALLLWCEMLNRNIYFNRNIWLRENKKGLLCKCCLGLAAILLLIAGGCFLESYINPLLLNRLLKIF